MFIDILCRVIDNLGDIGFVLRLSRALSELAIKTRLRLIVDNLEALGEICPGVQLNVGLQEIEGWQVVDWHNPGKEAIHLFLVDRPRLVLECYACGRPTWYEDILFDTNDPVPRSIVNIEYLTAESWAKDFHKLPSLTRLPLVRKFFFMPGFQSGTGGLLQNKSFNNLVDACRTPDKRLAIRRAALESLDTPEALRLPVLLGECNEPETLFWVIIFSYEHDFSSIVRDLVEFNCKKSVLALVAAGRSSGPFLEAWNRAGRPFPVLVLPLLPQTQWDEFLVASDFTVVRGEETLSRACLSGHPFLWQCYPFAETEADNSDKVKSGSQLPKVYAFLEQIKPFISLEDFSIYERLTLRFNGASDSSALFPLEPETGDLLAVLVALEARSGGEKDEFQAKSCLSTGFEEWARDVRNLGNFALNLLTFIRNLG